MGIPLDHTIFTHLATLRTLSEPHYRIHTKQDQLDLYLPQSYKLYPLCYRKLLSIEIHVLH